MVSIVIVNYRTGRLVADCVESIRNCVRKHFEVIIVDNSPYDCELDLLVGAPAVKVLRQSSNVGFARACNIGAENAGGSIIHFLNPDTKVLLSINQTYEMAEDFSNTGLLVTRILSANGEVQKTWHMIPTLSNIARTLLRKSSMQKWYLGASIVLRRSVFDQLGGFAEEYFMYCEDLDLFYRAAQKRIPVQETSGEILHYGGRSSAKIWSNWQRLQQVEASATIFARKFDIELQYFVFRHIAFFRQIIRNPKCSTLDLLAYWHERLKRVLN